MIAQPSAGLLRPRAPAAVAGRGLAAAPRPRGAAAAGPARPQQPPRATAAAAALAEQLVEAPVNGRVVQWYPGHIARAERQLKASLSMVDVVLEVRDARIPASTSHPQVPEWVGQRPRVLVMNRVDMITAGDRQAWDARLRRELEAQQRKGGSEAAQHVALSVPHWTDGKMGAGIPELRDALLAVGHLVNERRARRGLKPRAVRACVIGFPNIGKSALINRLVGRRVVESAPKPGVTRVLKWVRLGTPAAHDASRSGPQKGTLEMLDAPGIIPVSFMDQAAAQRLAMCNDIGEAAYLCSAVSASLVEHMRRHPEAARLAAELGRRYSLDPEAGTGEDFVVALADRLFQGDVEKAGARLLRDFRYGTLGWFALEGPAQPQLA
jgi:ribosome biogenesis GTP-binding protein YlqF